MSRIKRIINIEFYKYSDQFQIGANFAIHTHSCNSKTGDRYYHGHIWIDLGIWCIEISFMDKSE